MAFFGAFQNDAFQYNAFQIVALEEDEITKWGIRQRRAQIRRNQTPKDQPNPNVWSQDEELLLTIGATFIASGSWLCH